MSNLVTITTDLRLETDKAFAFFEGATHEVTDHATGEIVERPHYHWVPKALCTIKKRSSARDGGRTITIVEVEMSEATARDKGLFDSRCSKTGDLFR